MKAILSILLFLISLNSFSQYPFEKYPAISDRVFNDWKVSDTTKNKNRFDYILAIPEFFNNHDSLIFRVTSSDEDMLNSSAISLFRNKNQVVNYIEKFPLGLSGLDGGNKPDTAFVADYNGDHLNDLKIYFLNLGCGAFNFYAQVIYFFQRPDGGFTKISFTDLYMDFNYRKERDLNGDGNYEIITQSFQNYGKHNYWLFNIYNLKNNELVNVNKLYQYPIMSQILYRDNFKITKNLSREKMKTFSRKLPDDYSCLSF
ncbi:MAG: hypothetical protein Q8928_13595 [Bacteroidota bacterium]|nr:hypothetical protein [Bacteroidota bacterium]